MIFPAAHWARIKAEEIVEMCYAASIRGESAFFKRALVAHISKALVRSKQEGFGEATLRAANIARAACCICQDSKDDYGNKVAHQISKEIENLPKT